MKPLLLNLQKTYNYTQYRLEKILKMQSAYSIRLYEILCSKIMTNAKKTVHVKISVDSLRRTFDCTKKLKQFGQFRERVIDTAIKEINAVLNEALSNYEQITRTKEYRADQAVVKKYYEDKKNGTVKKMPDEVRAIFDKRKKQFQDAKLTKFGLINIAGYHKNHYAKNVSSIMANKIGEMAWTAMNQLIYGNGKSVKFKKPGEMTSIASDNKSGIRLMVDNGKYYLLLSNQTQKAKPMILSIKQPHNEYELDMITRPIKIVRIIRRKNGNRFNYFVQLTVEGTPPQKLKKDGSRLHQIREGKVGVYIKDDSVYAVADDGRIAHWHFCKNQQKYEEKKADYDRELSKLRQLNNPDNYDENGVIKKGSKKWHYSIKYKKILLQRSYLIHKNTESRNITRYVIANEILAMGNDIYILKKDYRTKKEKFDEDNRKSNEQYRRLKDRRKKIQNFAYADLISKIKSKIDSDNSGAVNEVTVSKDLYYYVHDEDKVNKSRFVDGIIAFKNRTCLEESYRALLIMNYDGKNYNRDMVEKGMSWIC